MEQPRKLVLFFAISLGFMLLWSNLVMPFFLPPKKKVDPAAAVEAKEKAKDGDAVADQGDDNPGQDDSGDKEEPTAVAQAPTDVEEAPATTVAIGSLDPQSGYFLKVTLTSKGAAIDSVELNDPKFLELDRSAQLMLVGDSPTEYRTLSTGVDVIDAELKKQGRSLEDWNWEYLPDETVKANGANSKVVFRVEIAGVEVRKTFTLQPVPTEKGVSPAKTRKTTLSGYVVDCTLQFRNKTGKDQSLVYQLQGPVGVRLENEEHARENRKIQVAFEGDQDAGDDTLSAKAVYTAVEADEVELWKAPFRYVGVDNTYFAALVIADPGKQTIGEIKPMVVDPNDANADLSDISLRLTSLPLTVAPGKEITHKFQMFAGPKRRELLDNKPLEASQVLNFGFTGMVARGMLSLLGTFHGWGLPYGLAIICLTVLVRGCMFPLSRKQALGAQKMKDLQPEIQALKDKYKDDKEKIAKAQMELFAKHKYNPFSGCLPLFFQFPIFIGLYTALYHAVDLRLARFLWIDNLAAPDSTFTLPFALPFGLGRDFSILPILTVILFLAQQKLFMPPPTSDEQAMQHKMMNFMTIAFGFFFWHSPAGLCLYFIASSLWGITERKLLGRMSDKKKAEAEANPGLNLAAAGNTGTAVMTAQKKPERKPGFLARKLQEAVEAANAANQTGTVRNDDVGNRKGKKKKKR